MRCIAHKKGGLDRRRVTGFEAVEHDQCNRFDSNKVVKPESYSEATTEAQDCLPTIHLSLSTHDVLSNAPKDLRDRIHMIPSVVALLIE